MDVHASPRPPRWRGTSPPYRSKGWCLWRTCSLKLLSTVLCWGIYCGRRRHWDRAPRLAGLKFGCLLKDSGRDWELSRKHWAIYHLCRSWHFLERSIYTCSDAGESVSSSVLSENVWKRRGALEFTGRSTASVGVVTSWRGLYIHVQMPVSRSQVPLFLEKVWKRRGALEFTGRPTASVGVCTSWRITYTC